MISSQTSLKRTVKSKILLPARKDLLIKAKRSNTKDLQLHRLVGKQQLSKNPNLKTSTDSMEVECIKSKSAIKV